MSVTFLSKVSWSFLMLTICFSNSVTRLERLVDGGAVVEDEATAAKDAEGGEIGTALGGDELVVARSLKTARGLLGFGAMAALAFCCFMGFSMGCRVRSPIEVWNFKAIGFWSEAAITKER